MSQKEISYYIMVILLIQLQFQIIQLVKPDEIYNLAAQSHVAVSFEVPEYTANADGLGVLRILEAIRFHRMKKKN
jgi:GDPmannose 4,6-dehydratase